MKNVEMEFRLRLRVSGESVDYFFSPLVGLQLQYNEISVYDSKLPSRLQNLSNVKAAIAMKKVTTGKLYNIAQITTLGNTSFTSFAKTGKFGKGKFLKDEVTIHTLPHLKCIKLLSVRSSHLPLKLRLVGFRAFKSPLY